MEPGNSLKVLYIGAHDSERDWVFGEAGGHRGWVPAGALLHGPVEGPPLDRLVPWHAKVVTTVSAVGPGYLDLVVDEELVVEYVGRAANNDAGWLFGSSDGPSRGWFPAGAVAPVRERRSCQVHGGE